uniref:Uncharacterized protein n=1 Tax=Meloidogyne hapla TaxID=6305 RepID=A0A1I8BF46_MELHA
MSTNHHTIPYLNMDQCMPRPGQNKHGSFGLIFIRENELLCDNLLICYQSQLSGDNTLNGTITSIPYRIRNAKDNIVAKLCEEKRKKLCDQSKNKALCSIGQPGSTTWHGIMLTTEYKSDKFDTTISLSIINKTGAYLHKYVGLWALGLDLLPSSAQRNLHLFVYRGCGCAIDVWFKHPNTQDYFVPILNKNATSDVVESFNMHCSKIHTNENIYSLKNLNDQEKLVRFTLRTSTKGSYGVVQFLNEKNRVVIGIKFYQGDIVFELQTVEF